MKKGIFCVAAMLFATTGFSQNVSLIDQVGTSNDVVIDQMSTEVMGVCYFSSSNVIQDGNSNYANIFQLGENKSRVEQIGDDNDALVYQDGGDGEMGGSGNYGDAMMQESEIYQRGNNNFASVGQWGEGNKSKVNQINDLSGGGIKGNKVLLEQEGRENHSGVAQEGDANWARTFQGEFGAGGKGNLSITIQGSVDVEDPTHESKYLQRTEVDQMGDKNYAKVEQYGDNQFSTIYQSALGGVGNSWTNEAMVLQEGHLNYSTIDQRDTDSMSADANNYASVIQFNNNPASCGNSSFIVQKGTNKATVIQNDIQIN